MKVKDREAELWAPRLTGFDDIVSQTDDQRVGAVCLELLSKLIQRLVKFGKISRSHR